MYIVGHCTVAPLNPKITGPRNVEEPTAVDDPVINCEVEATPPIVNVVPVALTKLKNVVLPFAKVELVPKSVVVVAFVIIAFVIVLLVEVNVVIVPVALLIE